MPDDELRDFALGVAERLPRLFPVLRPRGEQALSFALRPPMSSARTTSTYRRTSSTAVLPSSIAARRDGSRRFFARLEPAAWRQLLADVGGRSEVERAIAVGAVKLAVCKRRPRPRTLLAMLEDGAELPPGDAVGLVLDASW